MKQHNSSKGAARYFWRTSTLNFLVPYEKDTTIESDSKQKMMSWWNRVNSGSTSIKWIFVTAKWHLIGISGASQASCVFNYFPPNRRYRPINMESIRVFTVTWSTRYRFTLLNWTTIELITTQNQWNSGYAIKGTVT